MASENSTTFFLCLIVGFFLLRWILKYSSGTSNSSGSSDSNINSSTTTNNNNGIRREITINSRGVPEDLSPLPNNRLLSRPVTQSMIEVVTTVAPNLTEEQIRYDLQKTGNVEQTIERYLRDGNLPYPPGATPKKIPKQEFSQDDLISRFNLKNRLYENLEPQNLDGTTKSSLWSEVKEERQNRLRKQQEAMILNARKRLEAKYK